ncbi:hypothetical protein PF004_g19115 [Phytophthora fragariae]|uniref:Uncharacterized protein n=1 Tax=Phytophthora fragariae TaxID=53985 RepID=A0A6A3J3W9_9STRA|nr:hypothetical protein PF011_g18841 [Phytophthora fragariae]KAE9200015.1 hypothetical protein PF004_g19115 [Phytophthora fragariae]KAE9321022.1 hypothetical protein PF008_g17904 [Phytophthora fragariae]
MSGTTWYYCNLLEETSEGVPVVQVRQHATEDIASVSVVRSEISLAEGIDVDDELAVAISTYVLSASTVTTPEVVESEPDTPVVNAVEKQVATEPVVAEPAVEAVPEQIASESVAAETVVENELLAVELVEEQVAEPVEEHGEAAASGDAVQTEGEVIEEVVAEPVAVEAVADEAVNEPSSAEKEIVAEPVADEEVAAEDATEPVVVEEAVKEAVNEAAAVVETVHDAVETVAVVEEEIVETVVAQAAVEEEKPAEVEPVVDEPVAEPVAADEATKDEVPEAAIETPALTSEGPEEKADDVALDAIDEPRKLVTRMSSIPEDEENVVEAGQPAEEEVVAEPVDVPAVEKEEEVIDVAESTSAVEEALAAAKTVTDDVSDTQSEVSEAPATEAVDPAPVAKVDEEPESEIEETMVIDAELAAKEASAANQETSSFSFIPEQIRKNSYAVSSMAVAVTTAIVATLVARR